MADYQRLGGCLWRLFQLGMLVILLGFGVLFITREGKENEALKEGREERLERDPGWIGRIKEFFGGERGGRRSAESGAGSNALKKAQERNRDGHVELGELLGSMTEDMHKDVDLLAEGTTQVQQTVFWQIFEGVIYYRIILNPYDRPAHQMMLDPNEALFISFGQKGGRRIVPKAAAIRIETRTLRVATKDGYAAGWFVDGETPLEGQPQELVEQAQVGWIFSGALHARLRKVQGPERKPDGAVKDPYSIKTEAE